VGEQERLIRQEDTSLRMSMTMRVTFVDPESPFRRSDKARIAVLCRHDLSRLEPGDKIHTYDKIMAIARQASVVLFVPYGHASKSMHLQMQVVHVAPQGLRFVLALTLSLLAHRAKYECIYSRDPLLMTLAVPMKMFGKSLVVEMNGIPSAETEIRRRTHKVRAPKLTSLICGAMRAIETLSIRSADLILPVTEKMKNTLLRNYAANARRVVMIPNSVDTVVFKPLEAWRREIRQKLGMNREMVVLYLGTFSARWRGTAQLFEAAEHIQRRREDITFLVVGSGPLLEEMSAVKTGKKKASHILFAGAIDHQLVPLYMNAADLYVYDVTEAANKLVEMQGLCPTKILEAMACGKPVIAPKESELERMLQKSGGGLSASSMKELVELIEKLTDSPGLVKSMGAKARQYVELNHDLTRLTRRMIELINDIVSSRGR